MTGAPTLSKLLGLRCGERLALVGTGGKTSVANLLARENAAGKVLLMPTTKIWPPKGAPLLDGLPACLAHRPQTGLQAFGNLDAKTNKLSALPAEYWPALTQGYDLVLMEADGSAQLPCKGWRDDEPATPPFADRTLGVLSTAALGAPATHEYVLRLPLFLALTGQAAGQPITLLALAAMAAAPGGMFKGSAGQRVLLINQVENEAARGAAQALARLVRKSYPGVVQRVLAGSARLGRWEEL